MMRRRHVGWRVLALVVAGVLPGGNAAAQDSRMVRADSLIRVGDDAAQASRPREAIAAYEQAIALDGTRRMTLLPRLGRQYLWADAARMATVLFTEYLTANPAACETRLDLGLAQSWDDQLDAALATYDAVAAGCLYERGDARLGAARVLRWDNRFSAAERRYRTILADGSDRDREQAVIGLAYVRLAQARPRAALHLADSLLAAGSRDASAMEARVMALADLGALGSAVGVVHAERAAGRGSTSMDRLAATWEERARTSFMAGVRGFVDRDGTSYRAADVASGAAPLAFGAVRVAARAGELRSDSGTFRSREAELSFDLRPAGWLAFVARGGMRTYEENDFTPWEGELDVVLLPGDHHRIDIAAARLVIGDNLAAIEHELVGTFGSIGITERFGSRFSTALSVDATQWSEDNTRLRFRATPRLAFEGVPSVSLEWPTIYQRYDEPFAFLFFSPKEYMETGPALTIYKRVARVWYLTLYGRGGGLREAGRDWQALGIARASVEREVASHWGFRIDAGWSNSNLAGSAGFQRTSISAGFTIRP